VLWVSKADIAPRELPRKLVKLQNQYPNFQIRFVDEDLKSYKKIVHSFEFFGSGEFSNIVTADDDVYYPRYWLQSLLNSIGVEENMVKAYRGHVISFDRDGIVQPYKKWSLADCCNVSGNNLLPTGVSGVCYPLSSLIGVNNRKIFLKLAPTADDLWLKFITTQNGFRTCLVGSSSVHFVPVLSSIFGHRKGLERINVFEDENTKAFNRLMKHFNFTKKSFE
jgi:hypothetical protein